MIGRFAFSLMVAGIAGPAFAEPLHLSCNALPVDATYASLQQKFGAENITTETIDGAEGEAVKVAVLFPKDKQKRMVVTWKDEEAQSAVAQISVKREADSVPTAWDANGLTLNSTLADVETLNGKPFTLTGFDWDYGGYAIQWNGGKLDTLFDPCQIALRFEPDPGVKGAARAKVSGDKEFQSSNADMRAAKPKVAEILLSYP